MFSSLGRRMGFTTPPENIKTVENILVPDNLPEENKEKIDKLKKTAKNIFNNTSLQQHRKNESIKLARSKISNIIRKHQVQIENNKKKQTKILENMKKAEEFKESAPAKSTTDTDPIKINPGSF